MTKKEIVKFLVIRTIGNFLLLFAIFGVLSTLGPALFYEMQYRVSQVRGVRFTVADTTSNGQQLTTNQPEIRSEKLEVRSSPLGFGDILAGPKDQILIPPDPFFSILIPKIGASSRVFANVDPANSNEFLPVLQQGVAHAKGTVFPGLPGNTYLFAHSTDNFWDVGRYNAVFYLLKDLSPGDEIVLFFEGKRFNYKVTELGIMDASEVYFLTQSQGKNASQRLILQTCWPPGTSWKRLIVIAEPT